MSARLRLTNTLTRGARDKEDFLPIDPANVRMYACGPTVYDLAHIGNARPVIVFDVLFRLLRHIYGDAHVTYVRNVTDVDDKINARAAADFPDLPSNDAIRRLTTETERQFQADIRALGVLTPEDVNLPGERPRMIEPRATEHIDVMRRLIDRLVAEGHAYVAADHVLFDVPSMPDYGQLSRRPLDEMEAGARVDVAPYKRSPLDFVLWKPSGPGDPAWPSPADIVRPGRPGWHIECSAMSSVHLGETFDIHAGGLDLIFPHHENEIAQSRCCFGTRVMANYWLHNGFLQVEGQKMSKSLGNFTTIQDVLKDWPGEVVRLAMLRTHYRQPIDWTVRSLAENEKALDKWNREVAGVPLAAAEPHPAVLAQLRDDLNTPGAITELHTLFTSGVVTDDPDELGFEVDGTEIGQDASEPGQASVAVASARLMGLMAGDAARWPHAKRSAAVSEDTITALLEARRAARAGRNWAESDRIRDELNALGVGVKDNKDGTTTWEVVR